MTKITHPSMGRGDSVSAPTQETQSYVVEDTSIVPDTVPTIEEHLKKFEAKPEPTSSTITVRAPNPNKEKLESILFIGRLTKEVEIYGHKFELGSLTNREHNQMIKELYNFGEGADLFTIRILTLAHALRSINGVALEDIPIEGDFINNYYRKMAILDNMQLSLIEKLYEGYSELVGEVEEVSGGEEIKK